MEEKGTVEYLEEAVMQRNYNSLVVTRTWMKADDVKVKLTSVIFSVKFDNKEEDLQYVVASQRFLI